MKLSAARKTFLRTQFIRALGDSPERINSPERVDSPEQTLDAQADPVQLARCAMWVAALYEAGLQGEQDIELCVAQLLEIGDQGRSHGVADAASLAQFLVNQCGFEGNHQDYYAIGNSCLNRVVAARRGIPITLAIVYLVVGYQVGLDVRGISFPGHFLVGVRSNSAVLGQRSTSDSEAAAMVLLDPFSGRELTERDCLVQLERAIGANAAQAAVSLDKLNLDQLKEYLVPATADQILLRLLENLKQIHLQAKDLGRAMILLDYQIAIDANSFDLRRQQEILHTKLSGRGDSAPPVH